LLDQRMLVADEQAVHEIALDLRQHVMTISAAIDMAPARSHRFSSRASCSLM
jgi:hypothetical protein